MLQLGAEVAPRLDVRARGEALARLPVGELGAEVGERAANVLDRDGELGLGPADVSSSTTITQLPTSSRVDLPRAYQLLGLSLRPLGLASAPGQPSASAP
jgi:hypothetical protein